MRASCCHVNLPARLRHLAYVVNSGLPVVLERTSILQVPRHRPGAYSSCRYIDLGASGSLVARRLGDFAYAVNLIASLRRRFSRLPLRSGGLGEDELCSALADHNRWGHRVGTCDSRKNRGVGNTKTRDAADRKLAVYDR